MFNNTEKKLVKRLRKNHKKISFAESCTAGLISSLVGGVPGASEVFDEAYVTYSNKVKMRELGVLNETLEIYGAVSHQTALEMADGLKKKTDCDIAVSVTGIAGPGGGTDEKPVGLVYIGISTDSQTKAFKYIFKGSRNQVRFKTAKTAMLLALRALKEEK